MRQKKMSSRLGEKVIKSHQKSSKVISATEGGPAPFRCAAGASLSAAGNLCDNP
jgi:hypothetical protein